MLTTARHPKIMVVIGTRPEAIKMAPVISSLRETGCFNVRIVATAQHRGLLDQVLDLFDINPDYDLDLMQTDQSLDDLAARIITGLGELLDKERPDRVLVHGDTLTTMAASLACHFRRIRVGHVEAGLRSGDLYSPWPEEANRRLTGVIADLHFAPTHRAAGALRTENVADETIFVTGNTVVDALLEMQGKLKREPDLANQVSPLLSRFAGKRILAVTAHRRENLGHGMRDIAVALRDLATRDDVAIIFPMHPNPCVANVVRPVLDDLPNVELIAPLDYPNFVALMDAADLMLTDSGGVQEEAPSLRTPLLVMRDTTERPESVEAGTAKLVGTNPQSIVRSAHDILDQVGVRSAMVSARNPFGDGSASRQISEILVRLHAEETV